MEKFKIFTSDMCAGFEPRMFAVNHNAGEKLNPAIVGMLDPIDPATWHAWDLAANQFPELHFHAFDEYWLWSKGRTLLTIRLPDGRKDSFEISAGWIVYCVRGVEHSHAPLENWACFECAGVLRPGIEKGKHLTRQF